MPRVMGLYKRFLCGMDSLQPMVLLLLRVWMARVFFLSGQVKIADFETTISLFRDEYQVPFLSPVFAAYSATAFELLCPLLLVLGLCTRLATLPLLAMTLVIELTYEPNLQHSYWVMVLWVLLCFGAGRFSLDRVMVQRMSRG